VTRIAIRRTVSSGASIARCTVRHNPFANTAHLPSRQASDPDGRAPAYGHGEPDASQEPRSHPKATANSPDRRTQTRPCGGCRRGGTRPPRWRNVEEPGRCRSAFRRTGTGRRHGARCPAVQRPLQAVREGPPRLRARWPTGRRAERRTSAVDRRSRRRA
jgi:hypothetical protein